MKLIEFNFAPGKPWSTNDERNMHHQERARIVRDWKERTMVAYRSHMNQLKLPKDLPPGIVQVVIPFRTNHKRDPHNYCGTVLKAIVDGLVRAGAWPDDTPEWVGHREPILTTDPFDCVVTIYGRDE